MALTYINAQKLTQPQLAKGILRSFIDDDEMLAYMQFRARPGSDSFSYKREKALPSVEFVSKTHTSLTESGATFDQVSVPYALIESNVDVYDYVLDSVVGEDPWGIQLEKKLKATGRLLSEKIVVGEYSDGYTLGPLPASWTGQAVTAINPGPNQNSDVFGPGAIRYVDGTGWQYRAPGDHRFGPAVVAAADGNFLLLSDNPSNWIVVTLDISHAATTTGEQSVLFTSTTHEFDGLQKLCPSAQTIPHSTTDGDALSFDVMDQLLLEVVKVRNRRAFVCNAKLMRKFKGLLRGMGGASPIDVVPTASLGMGGTGHVMTYSGTPILQNDFIPSTEDYGGSRDDLSSLYCVSFDPEEGFFGAVASVGEGQMADVDPYAQRIMGLKLKEIGGLEEKAAERMRVQWFGTVALGSEKAIGRATGIITGD